MVMKRYRPRARGRAGEIKKPFSNLTIIVSEKKETESKRA
jgi:large subunit ribosomal protein L22